MVLDRILLHLTDSRRVPLDPDEIYWLETAEGDTSVRLRSRRREAPELFSAFEGPGSEGPGAPAERT